MHDLILERTAKSMKLKLIAEVPGKGGKFRVEDADGETLWGPDDANGTWEFLQIMADWHFVRDMERKR